ncbi:serine-rich adhesin for platelets-like [Anopheles darlingi]|uniref:serine-rich adhesin for platelets-like n=1 Tax=Anopheles darlingi TaxID=43151 RepID=UPI0021003366|nr:serine-rich adhesin for platelets-like [Anopheles darlingi]
MEDHDSATYSIESEPPSSRGILPSAEDTVLPALRRTAVQIVSQPLSPRRQASKSAQKAGGDGLGTMQITKLVLKTPPGSPKRHSKTPGIIIHSLQTFASPALRTGHEHDRTPDTSQSTESATSKVLVEHKNLPASVESAVSEAPYLIIPIVSSPGRKPSQKEHDDHQILESSKENKVPTQCIEITRLAGQERSDNKVQATIQKIRLPSKANGSVVEIKAQNVPKPKVSSKPTSQSAANEKIVYRPVAAARRSLLRETPKPATEIPMLTLPTANETIQSAVVEISSESKQIPPPPVLTESMKPPRPSGTQPKPPTAVSATRPPTGDCVKKKEKSYDPAKAREFIREQQAKRRQEKKDIPEQGAGPKPSEKELIKQRLENLKRSTTSLVKKNVQQARSRSVSCAPKDTNEPVTAHSDKPQTNGRSGPPPAIPKQTSIRKFPSSPSLQQPTSAGDSKEVHRKLALKTIPTTAASVTKAVKTSSLSDKSVAENVLKRRATSSIISSDSIRPAKARPSSARTSSSTLTLLPKRPGTRIGIMRKPDHMSLEDVLSPVHQTSSRPNQQITVTTPNAMVNAQLIVIKDDRGDAQSLTAAEKELKLDVPDVTLIPSNTVKLSSPLQEEKEAKNNADNVLQDHNEQDHHRIKSIPPWLKQSLQQPDPYPFIVAVRKKLEAVRNVHGEEDKKATYKQNAEQLMEREEAINPRTNAYLDIIHSVPNIAKKEQPRKINNEGSAISTNISVQGESNTSSEISSIKSDVVFPLPPLLSSTKVESYSAKFDRQPTSTSEPVSPLSVEKISGLKITASPKRSEILRASQRKEAERLKENIPPELPPSNESRMPEHSDRSQRELDYQRMLDAFNRSLTHVIEVNQQLYSALKKPPSPLRSVAVPQEIRKIRDEMTQTSAAMTIRSSIPGQGSPETPIQKASNSLSVTLAGTSTTASNYTDDFENQSQTGVGTPTEKPSIPDSTQIHSQQQIPSTVTSSSLASSSSPTTSSSSSSGSLVASDDGHPSTSPSSMSTSSYTSSGSGSFTDRQKSKSTTVNGRSSDFESHSSDHSDNSHNNTATNIVPPTAEEYLPSFEESLRRKQLSSVKHPTPRNEDKRNKTKEKSSVLENPIPQSPKTAAEKADNGEDSSIGEEIQSVDEEVRSFSLKLSEEITEQKLKEPAVQEPTLTAQQSCSLKQDSCDDVTFGSDLLATIFNRTDLEVSIMSTTISETNLSYSSIGLYDQLIHSERTKQEHLISRVQAKQKALLNRAKGQLAWLELQKQRFREKGQLEHISGIKKKQRAVLLRLEKERSELNRTIKSSAEKTNTSAVSRTPLTTKNMKSKLNSYCSTSPTVDRASLALRSSSEKVRSQSQRTPRTSSGSPANQRMIRGRTTETTTTTTTTTNSIQVAIRAHEIEPNDRLEDILLRREEELRKRKEHVRRLVEWHHKLDREEADLMAIEEKLRAYSNRKLLPSGSHRQSNGPTIEERMRSIEASLKTLQSIPHANTRHTVTSENEPDDGNDAKQEEVVEMVGKKLNRLWHRLTGDKSHRYEPEHSYHVTRSILEELYESAKRFVLDRFRPRDGQQGKGMLLEESIENNSSLATVQGESTTTTITNATTVANENEAADSPVPTNKSTAIKDDAEQDTAEEGNQPPSASSQETDDTSSSADLQKTESFDEKLTEKFKDAAEEELPVAEGNKSDGLLSSTAKSWSPESRKSTASVEFHTLEETAYQSTDFGGQDVEPLGVETPVRSESYSTTFEERSMLESENSQMLIEDMSLPPALLNNTGSFLLTEDEQPDQHLSERSSVAQFQLQEKSALDDDGTTTVESDHELAHPRSTSDCSDSMIHSLEEATGSSGECASTATTPTTVTPTMAIEAIDDDNLEQETVDGTVEDCEAVEEIDIGQPRSSLNSSSSTSELEKRLVTLHDELEELSETFERTPLMRSPTTPPPPLPASVTQAADTSATRSDKDGNNQPDSSESESLLESSKTQERGTEIDKKDTIVVVNSASLTTNDPNPAKIEIKHDSKSPLNDSSMPGSASGAYSATRNYPPVSSSLTTGGSCVSIGSTSPGPPSNTTVRMPDIINEAEVLRRQQLQIEQEIKELQQQVGFFREIPNKPPPPYIPPANGSPLALLFPSETRIDELINERLDELYRDPWLPVERLRSDHVTNVYEKLILDVCNELYGDLRPPEPTVSFRTIEHDKRPLAFYNPPDELRCMKDYLRRKVKHILNEEQLSLQQQHQQLSQFPYHQQLFHHLQQSHQQHPLQHQHLHHQQQQHHQLLAQCATVPLQYANGGCANKRKRDQVDEILAEEMHEDDARWTNFDREEIEVKDRITGELLKSLLGDAIRDMADAYRCKNQPDNKCVPLKESAM